VVSGSVGTGEGSSPPELQLIQKKVIITKVENFLMILKIY